MPVLGDDLDIKLLATCCCKRIHLLGDFSQMKRLGLRLISAKTAVKVPEVHP
jgi:hypothetical protein